VFEQACQFGCEGIVAKRLDSRYQSGRSKAWIKVKSPHSPRIADGTF
jgi:bifunctional non-homologous end joining protein LigD